MARLCCSDPQLFAQYKNAELDADLRVRSSLGSAWHSVSSQVLQLYSHLLADFCKVALTDDSDGQLVIDGPPKALEMFIHAIYGVSLTESLSPLEEDMRSLRDIASFGHKFNIAHIGSAVCEIITSHLDAVKEFEFAGVIDFYNEVPQDAHAMQDAIFQILLRYQTVFGDEMMEKDIAIAPRHVNEMLAQDRENPDWMLNTLELLVEVISCCTFAVIMLNDQPSTLES